MMGLDLYDEQRAPFLREKHKTNLPTRFREVFGDDGPALLKPILKQQADLGKHSDGGFDGWIRNILRKCRNIDDPERRRRYLEVSIERSIRITEIEDWLEKHPDLHEILAPHEVRDIPAQEMDAYRARVSEKENELATLRGDSDVLQLLISKVGADVAGTLLVKLCDLFSDKQCRTVIGAACRRSVRNTVRYLETVIERERKPVE